MTPRDLSRRRMLALTAAGAATTAGVAVVAPGFAAAGAAPARAAVGSERSAGFLAVPGRVTAVSGSGVDVEALDPGEAPAEPWEALPVVGFPWELVPRVGDHVTVTDSVEGEPLAVVPLCSWFDGAPSETPAGGYSVAGATTVSAGSIAAEPRAVLAAAVGVRTISVCLLDTDEADALVLQARTALTPTQNVG